MSSFVIFYIGRFVLVYTVMNEPVDPVLPPLLAVERGLQGVEEAGHQPSRVLVRGT